MKLLALASIAALFLSLKDKEAVDNIPKQPEANPRLAIKIARQRKVMRLMNLAIKDKNPIKQVQAMYILQQLNKEAL